MLNCAFDCVPGFSRIEIYQSPPPAHLLVQYKVHLSAHLSCLETSEQLRPDTSQSSKRAERCSCAGNQLCWTAPLVLCCSTCCLSNKRPRPPPVSSTGRHFLHTLRSLSVFKKEFHTVKITHLMMCSYLDCQKVICCIGIFIVLLFH